MRKLLIIGALIMSSFSYGQGFKAGINVGIPTGDVSDFYNLQVGADVAYMFEVADRLSIGPMIGYMNFFPEESDFIDNGQFLPVAAAGRYGLTDSFFLGADLGYGIGITDGLDGGFYYRPQVGYDFGLVGLITSYSGVSVDGGSWSSINLGVEFGL
ncbi:hypothetical protein [Christiangramia forsetii]|uniref:Secreted protein n=2 Tax=Christiangramia forsetii TaxID=411153 RepID=A0M2J6_CHRFK|nr:hypothetical protein [Christiangramia forsetii]GGG38943.1 hypothetical protein GCM10011532_23400 [Christiangramia forsetii]CAL66841.1 secreted protein [Christiangramia forsetii KT0803]